MRFSKNVVFLLIAAFAPVIAEAGPLDAIYDDSDVNELAASYQRGWKNNFDNVFWPVLSPNEKARLDNVDFRMKKRCNDVEPFGFMAGGNVVIVSAASLRFLEDIAMAYTWLERKGYSTVTVGDYLLMLRYWDAEDGRPPKPWDALCIPEDAFADGAVADRARRAFNTAAVFALLHEYGHVLYRHPGNRRVSAKVSRVNEAEADRFAFDLIVRAGDMPVGVPILFFMMAHLQENRADYASDEEYAKTLAARTHPVSPERLHSLARHMSASASTYSRNRKPGSGVSVLAIALEISQFAHLLADPGVQWLSARIGKTVRLEDLAPRLKGQQLAAPRGVRIARGPFSGTFRGEITGGKTPLEVDVIFRRDGDKVTGSYSFGAGFGRIDGSVEGATLDYAWKVARDVGRGRITLRGNEYFGTWGVGKSASGGGEIRLRPNR